MNKFAIALALLYSNIETSSADSLAWKDGATWKMSWDKEKSMIKMDVTTPVGTWFAFGWGRGMIGVDMVKFTGTGDNGDIDDLWSSFYFVPARDTEQEYGSALKKRNGDTYEFTAWRRLDTGDTKQDTKLFCGRDYNFAYTGSSVSSLPIKHNI